MKKLPSVRELALLRHDPDTIQKAYRDLESDGYVYSVAGKGTFVAEHQQSLRCADELLEDFDDIVEELCFLS